MPACTHCINYKTECIFTQIEKKRAPPKGYDDAPTLPSGLRVMLTFHNRAKYIEALENRLGRMEKLLRLAGMLLTHHLSPEPHLTHSPPFPLLGILVNDDDDLAELEKRLVEKSQQQQQQRAAAAPATSSGPSSPSHLTSESEATASPRSSVTSPDLHKDKDRRQEEKNRPAVATPASTQGEEEEEEVEALSEMMCSLVTNQCGETRYIGNIHSPTSFVSVW